VLRRITPRSITARTMISIDVPGTSRSSMALNSSRYLLLQATKQPSGS
jgi:hypothetical protein